MTRYAVLLLLAGCGGQALAPVDAPTGDAGAPDVSCVSQTWTVGVSTCREYTTRFGPVSLCCFDDPTEDSQYPDGCGGCGLDNGKTTSLVSWSGGYCKNSAKGLVMCKLPMACIASAEDLCP
jgi:hypothetical protein